MADRHMIAVWRTRAVCALLSAQFVGAVCEADAPTPLNRQDLARCTAIPADDRRLACYDALAGGLGLHPTPKTPDHSLPKVQVPSASTNPPMVDDEKIFGLSKPLGPVARGPDSLHANVAEMTADSLGKVTVLLDNDQTWTFNDANALLRKGDAVVIKRAALGSFIMTTPSKRTYRVRRIK